MPIDKIGPAENYTIALRNIMKPKPQLKQLEPDTIYVSQVAKQNAEIQRVYDLAMAAPDIRTEKIAELRRKLQDPSYPGPFVIERLAEELLHYYEQAIAKCK